MVEFILALAILLFAIALPFVLVVSLVGYATYQIYATKAWEHDEFNFDADTFEADSSSGQD